MGHGSRPLEIRSMERLWKSYLKMGALKRGEPSGRAKADQSPMSAQFMNFMNCKALRCRRCWSLTTIALAALRR